MTLRETLLDAAGHTAAARPAVAARAAAFVRARVCPGGGFADRSGRPDLYYTVFGLQTLAAVEASASRAGESDDSRAYLARFDPADLDVVHLCCLLRCRALIEPKKVPGVFSSHTEKTPGTSLDRLETFRAVDGGYSHVPGAEHGTAYGAFLALGAYEDAGAELPDPDRLADSLGRLRAADGGYAGSPGAETGLVPSTAAAVVTLAALGRTVDATAVDWLTAAQRPTGGWPAAVGAPTADLLSSATALHALSAAGATLGDDARAAARTFVESLIQPAGPAPDAAGFRGHAADTIADCEYTFYGLLALGHLT